MNNHQNAIFHQLDNFIKHSHSFAMTIFHKINNSAKLVTLLIIPKFGLQTGGRTEFILMSLIAFGALGIPIPAKSRQPPKPNYTNITSNHRTGLIQTHLDVKRLLCPMPVIRL
jgi:hypothetical protein